MLCIVVLVSAVHQCESIICLHRSLHVGLSSHLCYHRSLCRVPCGFLSYFVSNLNLFLYFNWKMITIQHCDGFCCTSTLVSHRYTCVQHILQSSPHPSPPYSSGFFQVTNFGCPASCICTPEG